MMLIIFSENIRKNSSKFLYLTILRTFLRKFVNNHSLTFTFNIFNAFHVSLVKNIHSYNYETEKMARSENI
jgi:hypothetical protein